MFKNANINSAEPHPSYLIKDIKSKEPHPCPSPY